MDPALLLAIMSLITTAIEVAPKIIAEISKIKDPDQLSKLPIDAFMKTTADGIKLLQEAQKAIEDRRAKLLSEKGNNP